MDNEKVLEFDTERFNIGLAALLSGIAGLVSISLTRDVAISSCVLPLVFCLTLLMRSE